MRLAECAGDAAPAGFGLGRSALHVGHHHQTAGKVPAVRGRDRHRHRHPFTVQMSQQAGLPGEISVAALAETTDREVAVDTHAPHPVDASSASEPFAANDVVTPLLKCLPSHRPHLRRGRVPRIQKRATRALARMGWRTVTTWGWDGDDCLYWADVTKEGK